MIQLPEFITASDYHDSTAAQQIYVALSLQIFLCHVWMDEICSSALFSWFHESHQPTHLSVGQWQALVIINP